jgi:hypothetical protein
MRLRNWQRTMLLEPLPRLLEPDARRGPVMRQRLGCDRVRRPPHTGCAKLLPPSVWPSPLCHKPSIILGATVD